ncbi:cytochrome P450 [Nocardia blacklockiae]|uniref:cytochrome P450 n=1 Tax=Nocardia blacklockiae TaxID=480036 RepID=UPI0018945BA3|nr:cytochrome P450 [Nocardia blacklockiae]MBF6173863.1 cytochrome P450 [Nocardia blacklockiae]
MRTRLRWAAIHGLPRVVLKWQARRGDPLGRILSDPRAQDDPYALADRIRAQGPLVRTRFTWVTADHAIVRKVLRSPDFGVVVPAELNLPRPIPAAIRATDPHLPNPIEPPAMLAVDPPRHTRYRKLVAQEFTPRAVRRLTDRIDEVTAELLAELAARHRADLIGDFAVELPAAIISEMLGIPAEVRGRMLTAGEAGAALLDTGISWRAYRRAQEALADARDFLDEHLDRLRASPGDNILSALVTGDQLTTSELMYTTALLAGAGFETTVNLIGNGVVALHRHPEQLALLAARPELWPGAVEEILRYDSPVQWTVRKALRDMNIEGRRVARGAMVTVLLGGANRDPKVFADPNTFDVTRPNAREHVSFSSGVHSCLGATLARTEGVIALRTLHEHFPTLRLSATPVRRELMNLRGYAHIPVLLGSRDPAPP